ncbi:MAG: methyltransferase domain-containing protein [Acidobacteria bacterium]|uniref:Methyltransferase domain-containing protein n=1 Tax=Candidatus Polarisedimenticola svalbardensis TaxID=2886004 RepID=A0A8J6Y700_9BACT|nr:methyltransferase domain-containing protein [Candidatus Polarisedimenticola svalbardensis]
MRHIWHPVSSVFMPDPPVLATPVLLNLLLRSGTGTELIYAGDRMWPALRDGCRVHVMPSEGEPGPGQVVLCDLHGVVDILRVNEVRAGALILAGDSDAGATISIRPEQVLGLISAAGQPVSGVRRSLRRHMLDLGETVRTWSDSDGDPSDSVLTKYDYQAPFYAGTPGDGIDPDLLEWIRSEVPAGGKILVAGCGAGRECMSLAIEGYRVVGIDFSPGMIELAEKAAASRKMEIRFQVADLRTHNEPVCSLDAVLFTYDVYSFIPKATERINVLSRIGNWLRPEGVVFLSARRVGGVRMGAVLSLQWVLRLIRSLSGGWGAGHTRWIAGDATLRRSFVQHFTLGMLVRETGSAGFVMGRRGGGHTILRKRLRTSPVRVSEPVPGDALGQEC